MAAISFNYLAYDIDTEQSILHKVWPSMHDYVLNIEKPHN